MTENEAIKVLVTKKQCIDKSSSGQCKINCGDCKKNIPIAYQEKSYEVAIIALKEIQQYREIGSVEECREAVEKQKPKKTHPLNRDSLLYKDGWRYKCPICGCAVGENVYHSDVTKDYEYCSMCGQKIEE